MRVSGCFFLFLFFFFSVVFPAASLFTSCILLGSLWVLLFFVRNILCCFTHIYVCVRARACSEQSDTLKI